MRTHLRPSIPRGGCDSRRSRNQQWEVVVASPDTALVRPPGDPAPRVGARPATVAVVVVVAGLLISVSSAWIAWMLNQRNERDLLEVQTQQAAAVLSGTILNITGPITTTLRVAQATDGDPGEFSTVMTPFVGPDRVFVSATLWDTTTSPARAATTLGDPSELAAGSASSEDFIARARIAPTFLVTNPGGSLDRVAYALGDPQQPRFVVYAERAIPASKVVPVQRTAAFAGLDFATYLGSTTDASTLATTNVPETDLPLTGDLAGARIPFGDTTLTLVTRASDRLGGELGQRLPWVFLLGGILLTATTALAVTNLVRSRRRAEADRQTIAGLYEKLDDLYGEQRGIAMTLQHALLPSFNPEIAGLEIASRYIAGAEGVDIGGDWYSMIGLDDDRFGFVVGDVSGRGIDAAAVMARLRFTIRAYLAEGHPPGEVLDMCARQFDISVDDHFATVLVGVVALPTRTMVLASAGHFAPLILTPGSAEYALVTPAPPLGTGHHLHATTTMTMPAGSTLLAFTDGLIERRTEGLDVGLDRLARTRARADRPLDDLLEQVADDLTPGATEDDIALLAFRWRDTQTLDA